MRTELTRASVSTTTGVTATAIRLGQSRRLRVEWGSGHAPAYTEADWVVLATYSALNQLLEKSELPPIPLVHELAEIVIVNVPSALREIGITVMDGPFWSAMPFPALNAHSLTHVRYTPHARWHSSLLRGQPGFNEAILQAPRDSHAEPMRRDAARYFPELQSARPMTSLWEIKTVLPRSEVDDSRPILVRPFAEAPGLIAVLGAKIDSVYDVENVITRHLTEGGA
jgi:glycine/D-amino acid oxidase-like deaminating enzyme